MALRLLQKLPLCIFFFPGPLLELLLFFYMFLICLLSQLLQGFRHSLESCADLHGTLLLDNIADLHSRIFVRVDRNEALVLHFFEHGLHLLKLVPGFLDSCQVHLLLLLKSLGILLPSLNR